MITPNKFIGLDDSILAKLEIVLDQQVSELGIRDLYQAVGHKFDTADEFLLVLDVLYVLECINVDFKTGRVSHAR